MYKRKIIVAFLVLMLTIGALFSPYGLASTKEHEGVTIHGIIGAFGRFDPLWGPYDGPPEGNPLVHEFEKETGIRVEVEKVIFANLADKEMLELTSPKGYASFVTINSNWYARFAEYLEPLEKYINNPKFPEFNWNDVTEAGKKVVTINSTIYGFPLYVYSPLVAYRKDLYEQHGLTSPDTWTELAENAEKLTVDLSGDGKVDRYGISFIAKKAECIWWPLSCLYGFGGKVFDKNRNVVIDNERGIASFKTFCRLIPSCPPGILGNEFDTVNLQFRDDKIAMNLTWPYMIKQMRETVLSEDMVSNMGIARIQGDTFQGEETKGAFIDGWGISIPKNVSEKEKDAAYLFINWLASRSTMRAWQFTKTPGPPALRSVLLDPEVIKMNPEFPPLEEQMKIGETLQSTPQWFEIEEVLRNYYQEGIGGMATPEYAMHQAAGEIRQIMEAGQD